MSMARLQVLDMALFGCVSKWGNAILKFLTTYENKQFPRHFFDWRPHHGLIWEIKLQERVPATHSGSWNVQNSHGTRNMWAMWVWNKFLFWDWVLGSWVQSRVLTRPFRLEHQFFKAPWSCFPICSSMILQTPKWTILEGKKSQCVAQRDVPRVCLSEQIVAQERETRTIGQHKPAGALQFGALGKRPNLLTGNLCGIFSGRFGRRVVHGQTYSTTIGSACFS